MRARLLEFVPGLIGGVGGGIAGYLLMGYFMATLGYRVPILPGAFAGLACGQLSAVYSARRGWCNAISVAALVVYAQWKLFDPPFESDGTLVAYVQHLHQLPALTLILFAINIGLGYWWGREQGIAFPRTRVLAPPTDSNSTQARD